MLQWKNAANEATDVFVGTFDVRCRVAQSASEQLQLCELSRPTLGFTMRGFSMVGGYTRTENPESQNCHNWGGRLLGTINTVIAFVKPPEVGIITYFISTRYTTSFHKERLRPFTAVLYSCKCLLAKC